MDYIEEILPSLQRHPSGIWLGAEAREISYRERGHSLALALEDISFWFKHRTGCILAALSARRREVQAPFWDIGGSNGLVASAIQQAIGGDAVLVEPSFAAASKATERGVRHVICAAWQDLEVPERCIPAAGLFDVLEHVAKDVEFLSQIRRALLPGGSLFVTVPAYDWLWSVEDKQAGHLRRYTLNSLQGVLIQAGLLPVFSTYFFSFLPLPILFGRTLPSLLKMRRNTAAVKTAEHCAGRSIFNNWLAKIMGWELARLAKGQAIPFGSSCLAVAQAG